MTFGDYCLVSDSRIMRFFIYNHWKVLFLEGDDCNGGKFFYVCSVANLTSGAGVTRTA